MIGHSYFSLRYGVMSPITLCETFKDQGFPLGVLADVNSTSAIWDVFRWSRKEKFPMLTGVDVKNGVRTVYVAIPHNEQGWLEVNEWLSYHLQEQKIFPERAPEWKAVTVVYPIETIRDWPLEVMKEHEWIGVGHQDIHKWRISRWMRYDRCIACPVFSFRNQRDFNIHRLLRAVEMNTLLSKLSVLDQSGLQEKFIAYDEVKLIFQEHPMLLENTTQLFQGIYEIQQDTDLSEMKNQRVFGTDEESDFALLRDLCWEGMSYRYPNEDIQDGQSLIVGRLNKELALIQEKSFVAYFLINWDITSYARSKGYFYVGRGSGANSIVAYLLRITDVDPIELDLYFERFINLYRQNPPDFDIDFSWTDREDMTQYIFSRFSNVTLLGAYNTFQYRAAVRELGKVFGLPKEDIDLLSDGKYQIDRLDELQRLTLRYASLIQDFPNALAIHAAGILITQKSIHHYTSTFLPPKGFPTTQFDMLVAEDIGIYKFDILSQRGLGKIKECMEIISYNQPHRLTFDIHNITLFKRDIAVKDLIRSAQAIGCFYVESPAMRMLLTKLQVDDYLGLVAASSVIRPGVSKSGMMREFILRQRFPERRKSAHPVLLEIMPETYGVMVYQEDVIKVAHFFGGLSLAEADALRRGMSGKFRGRDEFERARNTFVENALAKGNPLEDVLEIWRQIESFAGYAFAKGHSASYAVESFQSLYLKAHFPLEYMVATINNGGGFYSVEFYVQEARRNGAVIQGPCINRSSAQSIINENVIYLGLGMIRDLEHSVIERILQARKLGGCFVDADDFLDRVHIGLEQCVLLVRIGALRFTGLGKKELLWKVQLHFMQNKNVSESSLFGVEKKQFNLPKLSQHALEDAYDEMEILGFPLCSPFDLVAEHERQYILAEELPLQLGKWVQGIVYFITCKPTRTGKGERMYFGNFLDVKGGFVDTAHFPMAQKRNMDWRGQGVYWIKGKVMEEFGAWSIEVDDMRKLAYLDDPRYSELRAGEKSRLKK
jgi:DNA polymerase-3 subunit alpha